MRPAQTHVLGSIISFFQLTAGILVHALTHLDALRRRPVMEVTFKQIYFTGIQALLPASFAAVAIGLTMETQLRALLGSGIELNVKMLKLVVLREFAPLPAAAVERKCWRVISSNHGTLCFWPKLGLAEK